MAAFVERSCELLRLNLASSLRPMTSFEGRWSGWGGRGRGRNPAHHTLSDKHVDLSDRGQTDDNISCQCRVKAGIKYPDPFIDAHQCQDVSQRAQCSHHERSSTGFTYAEVVSMLAFSSNHCCIKYSFKETLYQNKNQ